MAAAAAADTPSWYSWLMMSGVVDWDEFNEPLAPGEYKPALSDLLTAVPCTLVLLILRFCFERWLARPIGLLFRLSGKRVSPSAWFTAMSSSLEPHYRRAKQPDEQQLQQLSQQLNYSVKSISNWFRVRRNKDKPSILERFTESSWYVLYYSLALAYGLYVLWDEPYFWDSEKLWEKWPRHHVPAKLYWYYMLQLGYYVSSLMTLSFDVRRKDFGEMMTHHLVTILLILLSWALNFLRVGSLTLLLHDAVDPLLNFGKLGQYVGATAVSDSAFVLLIIVWVATRLVLLPYRVVYSVYADSLRVLQLPVNLPYCLFLAGFCALQLLHFIWTYYIVRILVLVLRHGKNAGDIRSDSEIDEDEAQQKEK